MRVYKCDSCGKIAENPHRKSMKKILVVAITLLFVLSGCAVTENKQYVAKEQPHLYWKDIDVTVTKVAKKHWYASTHWYDVKISVKSDEYQLNFTQNFRGGGFFGRPKQWKYKEGDIVKAELFSWVMDSTGKVVKREINQIY